MSDRERREVDDAGRRRFLTLGAGGLGGVLAAATLGPAVVYVAYPVIHVTSSGADGFVPVGRSARFTEGKPVKTELYADVVDAYSRLEEQRIGSAWVVRRAGKLVALSTVCPHLGCAIDWSAQNRCFECPCHRSRFAIDGKRESGPSPRGMDQLELREHADRVEVRYKRFRQGIAQKVPV